MPWRGPEHPGDFPTLGYLVADWIEAKAVIPDGAHAGEPYLLTDEMVRFLVWHYRLRPNARPDVDKPSSAFVFRRSQLVRPQKWGKGPFSAAMVCAEADEFDGVTLFDGWDAAGEPVGRPWPTPWIQVTAASEDQTDNVWNALVPMIELGDLAADFPDTGETRINLPGGGVIEPTTAAAKSRLGQRITFALQDETHSWLKANGGHKLAQTQRRNLAGMGGRSIETTNGWDPAEQSVAQLTDETTVDDVYRDRTIPPEGDFTKTRDRKRIIRVVYGDSWWVDLERINADAEELIDLGEVSQAARFFGNMIEVSEEQWLDPAAWDRRADTTKAFGKRELVTLGFDGARWEDSTALIVCRLSDGHLAPLELDGKVSIWEKPDGPAGDGWEVDGTEVDAFVAYAFAELDVVLFYADPPYWQDEVSRWASEYGDKIVKEWWTNRERAMVAALERLHTAVMLGDVAGEGAGFTHSGQRTLARHVANCRRRQTRSGVTVRKERPGSPLKIDAAVAGTLAYEARADALAAGKGKRRKRGGGGA